MQLPFPRLIHTLDDVAGRLGLAVVAQALEPLPGLRHIEQRSTLTPHEFDRLAARSSLIVGHAGIGTILSAAQHGKPLILFPRRADLGEHRNDHQMATARQFGERSGVYVAHDALELTQLILRVDLQPYRPQQTAQMQHLVGRVAGFIAGGSDA